MYQALSTQVHEILIILVRDARFFHVGANCNMSKRELAALRRDAEEREAEEREILRRRLEPDCIYCNRSPPCRCVCFLSFDAAMAAGDYTRVNQFFNEVWLIE